MQASQWGLWHWNLKIKCHKLKTFLIQYIAANFDTKRSFFPQNQQEPVFSPGSMQYAKSALQTQTDRDAFRGKGKA